MPAFRPTTACLLIASALLILLLPVSGRGNPTFEWVDLYDGGIQQADVGAVALTDAAGDLYVAGESADGVGGLDFLIRRIDRDTHDTVWTRRVAADDGNDMEVGGMVWDGSGNLLLGGTRLGCFG